jgi:hypothetical protein
VLGGGRTRACSSSCGNRRAGPMDPMRPCCAPVGSVGGRRRPRCVRK